MPPIDIALEGLQWFVRCGDDREIEPGGKRMMWFDFDSARLYASFRHEDPAMSHALQIRGTDTSKMKGKQKQEYERLKRNLTPAPALSEEEKEAIDAFWAQIN